MKPRTSIAAESERALTEANTTDFLLGRSGRMTRLRRTLVLSGALGLLVTAIALGSTTCATGSRSAEAAGPRAATVTANR